MVDESGSTSARGVKGGSGSPRRFIMVANRTGGQGKTLISHLLAAGLRRTDPHFNVMCADSVQQRDGISVSKLGRSVKGVIEVGSGPSAAEVSRNPSLAYSFWDEIGAPLLVGPEHGLLLDVGANVVDQIIDWSASADLGSVFDGQVVIDLVVPVVATSKALADAQDVVHRVVSSRALPVKRVHIVENAWQGPFSRLNSDPNRLSLVDLVKSTGGSIIPLPECVSEVLGEIERRDFYFGDVFDWKFQDVAGRFGWSVIQASRELKAFLDWRKVCDAGLEAAGLYSPFVDVDFGTAGDDGRGSEQALVV